MRVSVEITVTVEADVPDQWTPDDVSLWLTEKYLYRPHKNDPKIESIYSGTVAAHDARVTVNADS